MHKLFRLHINFMGVRGMALSLVAAMGLTIILFIELHVLWSHPRGQKYWCKDFKRWATFQIYSPKSWKCQML